MNTKSLLIAALATAFAGAAFATSKTPADLQQEAQLHAPSVTTRAAVMAEVLKARANGTLNVHPDYGNQAVAAPSQLTRAEVMAQVIEARAAGTLNVHPDYGNRAILAQGSSTLMRAEIRAATAAVIAQGARLSQGEKSR